MAIQEQVKCLSVPAAGNLSAKQWHFMVVDAAGEMDIPAGAGLDADGVLLDKPKAQGRVGSLAFAGCVKVEAGTAGVTAGDKVQTDAAGCAVAATTLDHVLGKALTTAANGELAVILLISKHVLA